MFKFNFSQVLDYPLDEEEQSLDGHEAIRIEHDEPQETTRNDVCVEITLEDLMKTLSTAISYTPLIVRGAQNGSSTSTSSAEPIIIPRRDLYDARFQIISEETLSDSGTDDAMEVETDTPTVQNPAVIPLPGDHSTPSDRLARQKDLEYIDAPSDVIPNIYEGGLKTWECSVDLVEYLSQTEGSKFRGRSILEVGCGTAIPSAFILRSLFDEEPSPSSNVTTLHLQDYNRSVLELVTIPNLLLAWYSSKASSKYRESKSLPAADPTSPAEMSIDAQLLDAFTTSLNRHSILLRFSAGSWSTFEPRQLSDQPFDLVITSETIYRSANVGALLSVLHNATSREQSLKPGLFSSFSLFGRPNSSLILVAAKVLYFGVGGSVDEFKRIAKESGAIVTTVQQTNVGVGRRIMKLQFL